MNFLIKTVLVVEVLCSLIVDGGVPNKKVEVESVLERLKRDYRVSRQAADFNCTISRDCLPANLQSINVPDTLVSCVDRVCRCNDCFMLSSTRKCFTCRDYPFNTTSLRCGMDSRQNQRAAFFLSLFFSSTGAANFYIGSYGLAIGQLIVLIIFVMSVYILICPCCICCGLIGKEGAIKGSCLFLLLFVLAIVFVVVMAFLIISWWIGELVIFRNNERLTGAGCFPIPNL